MVIFKCDVCGKKQDGILTGRLRMGMPSGWFFSRTPTELFHVCGSECVREAPKKFPQLLENKPTWHWPNSVPWRIRFSTLVDEYSRWDR